MSRNVVITGAGSGIGARCAELVTEAGDTAIGVDLRGAEFEADLTDSAALEQVVKQIADKYGHVDGVIANAGVQASTPLDLKANYFGAHPATGEI